jgi:hypothetical protein
MPYRPEETDLAELATELMREFAAKPPRGYLPGRTLLRDAVASRLNCSQLEAEQLVDTMKSRGFLRYDGDASTGIDDMRPWAINCAPGSAP